MSLKRVVGFGSNCRPSSRLKEPTLDIQYDTPPFPSFPTSSPAQSPFTCKVSPRVFLVHKMRLYGCHFYELVRRVLINLMTTEYEYPCESKYEYKSHTCLSIKKKLFKKCTSIFRRLLKWAHERFVTVQNDRWKTN